MKKKLWIIITSSILLIACIVATIILAPVTYKLNDYIRANSPIETIDNNENIVVMSSNLRCFNYDDKYEKCWTFRAPYVKKNIESVNPDIIGFQEYTPVQKHFITTILSNYDHIETYRDNSSISEGCPIFYKKDRFTLIDKGSFWLSKTPDVMSIDWDAACYRICSYAILKDNNTTKEIAVFNTHLDHISEEARVEGIKLVLAKINEFGFDNKASILMGDMNDTKDSTTIETLYEYFDDSALIAKDYSEEEENKATYQGFGRFLYLDRIDYLAVSKTGIEVNSYKVLDTTYSNKKIETIYPSDHFPIYINITLK